MKTDGWYDIVSPDVRLTLGDLIADCPIISWASSCVQLTKLDDLKSAINAVKADVVVRQSLPLKMLGGEVKKASWLTSNHQ
jgi:hypothetical protein